MKTKIDFNKLSEQEVNQIIEKARKRLDDILANDRTPIDEKKLKKYKFTHILWYNK